jgi:hypothetical protein
MADMSKCFEYIGILLDPGDLHDLNALGCVGWHVVAMDRYRGHALLEREVEDAQAIERTRHYYEQPEQALKRPLLPPVPPWFTGGKSEPRQS